MCGDLRGTNACWLFQIVPFWATLLTIAPTAFQSHLACARQERGQAHQVHCNSSAQPLHGLQICAARATELLG